ncbi:MAG: penicillin-binding transpeptidase domain-containing protein, partial [Candidatus Eremiobacterota bacterium]
LYGTGGAADTPNVAVAGKTGTVESFPNEMNPHGRNHVWFVSYAPADHPQLVVVVLLEKSGGYGGGLAAPIARKVYDFAFPAK